MLLKTIFLLINSTVCLVHSSKCEFQRNFYNIHSIFSDAVAGGLLGEAKRDANKTRILLGLFKEPEVPELENEDEQLDDLEPSKKKRKNKAITVRKTRPDHNAPATTRIPIIGLTENQLTSADKMDWLLYYKDIEQRIKLTGGKFKRRRICVGVNTICQKSKFLDQRISCVYYSILNSNNGLQPTSVTFRSG